MLNSTALQWFAYFPQQYKALLENVPDERWAEQPAGIPNHPAWTLGHLRGGISLGLKLLGQNDELPADWGQRFGMGSQPVADRSAYPDQNELWDLYEDGHAALAHAVTNTADAVWSKPVVDPQMSQFFPTIGAAIAYILMVHEPDHLGQLKAWKRAAGLAS